MGPRRTDFGGDSGRPSALARRRRRSGSLHATRRRPSPHDRPPSRRRSRVLGEIVAGASRRRGRGGELVASPGVAAGTRCGSSSTCAPPAAAATRSPRRCAGLRRPRRARHPRDDRARARPRPARGGARALRPRLRDHVRRIERPGDAEALVRASGALVNEVVGPPREAFLGDAEAVAGRRGGRPRVGRGDRRLPARHPGAAAGRADHRRGRRLPARAARRRARACTARATRASAPSSCSATAWTDEELIDRALAEDVGDGDATTEATVDADARGARHDHPEGAGRDLRARRRRGRVPAPRSRRGRSSGSGREGVWREAGRRCCASTGRARALLTAERTALNFLGRLSGVATLTARVVRAVAGAGGTAKILDTRKTTPGLRRLEKAAVARRRRRQPPRRALRRDPDQGEPLGARRAAWARRCGAPARRGRTCRSRSRCATRRRSTRRSAAGAPRLLLDNMTPERDARRGRAGRRAGGARGVAAGSRRDSFGLCDH